MRALLFMSIVACCTGCGTTRQLVHPDCELDIIRHGDQIGDVYDVRTIGIIYGKPTVGSATTAEIGYAAHYRKTVIDWKDIFTLGVTAERTFEVWYLLFSDPSFTKTDSSVDLFVTEHDCDEEAVDNLSEAHDVRKWAIPVATDELSVYQR